MHFVPLKPKVTDDADPINAILLASSCSVRPFTVYTVVSAWVVLLTQANKVTINKESIFCEMCISAIVN